MKTKLIQRGGRLLGSLCVAGPLFACVPQSEKVAPVEVTVDFLARTVVGEPLSDVSLSVSGAATGEYQSDEHGRARALLQAGDEELLLKASCPEGYVGESVERRLAGTLLAAISESENAWLVELVCQNENPEIALLLLSEGCGELTLELDGKSLGKTRHGAFQDLVPRPQGITAELHVEPEDAACQLEKSAHVLSLADAKGEFFVRARGKKRARVIRRRAPAPQAKSRPYRL